jgi:tRNA-2-methylthio-N6-dimethylallyladenosine synthase
MKKSVFIRTFGCQMNVRDSELILGSLLSGGYKLAQSADSADIILFNTCSVRQHAEDKAWSEIGRYKGTLKVIGLVGCMAEYHKAAAFRKAPPIDFVCGPNDIGAIPSLIEAAANRARKARGIAVGRKERDESIYNTGYQADKKASFVVIAEGCNNFCSYCVVPFVRSRERSRHYGDILAEIRALAEKGVKEITLLGQNVNSYCDGEVDFPKLLELVDATVGLKSFSFVTSHPKDASRALFEAMARLEKLKKCLHLPLQSGSDKILKSMKRGYTLGEYLRKAGEFRKIVGGTLATDIIVGFPGEKEKDFLATKRALETLRFGAAYIFKYSARPHTAAYRLKDDVPEAEKRARHKVLLDLQKEISQSIRGGE